MENNDDKTIIYSNNTNPNSDKTIISEPNSGAKISSSDSEQKKANPSENDKQKNQSSEDKRLEDNKEILKEKTKSKSSGIHPGVFAGGVAAAAAGGVAAGTVYSEEIKDFFTKDNVEEATIPAVESDVSETAEISAQNNEAGIEMPEGVSALNISGVTSEGNSFEVSFMDLDNNGVADMQFAEIDLGDGSTFEVFQTGDSLGENFFAGFNNAQFENSSDISFANLSNNIDSESSVESYTIQPGDTLSEIAAAHDTSIEHIMELNTDIENPDLIYAGSTLQIPLNDGIENPYQVDLSSENSLEFADTFDSESFNEDDFLNAIDENVDYAGSNEDGFDSQDFDSVDWDSFEDQPVDFVDSDYSQLLADADFDNLDVTSDFV